MANPAAQYHRDAQRLNAVFKDLQLLDALGRGREAEVGLRRQAQQLRGQQGAALAASGVAVDSGSALTLQEESTYISELDVERAKANAAREAWGLRISGKLRRLEADAAYAGSQGQKYNPAVGVLNAFKSGGG